MPIRQKMMRPGAAVIGLILTIRLTYVNANNVGRGSVGKIVGGKSAPIKAGSTCFSPAFAARLRRWF